MPNKMDKELKRKFGAYLKVSILNAKKEYLIELNKIIKTETSLDEVDSIEDKAAERMLENVCISAMAFFAFLVRPACISEYPFSNSSLNSVSDNV